MTPLDGAVDVTEQGAAATTRKRILVVDDEVDIRTLVATSLTRAGFDVTQATDGPSALEAASADPPDLVVLDLMMPGVPGLEVCKRLRAAPQTAQVPVILLTAVNNPSYVAIGYESGAVHYMTKPFSPSALVNRVRTVLRGKS